MSSNKLTSLSKLDLLDTDRCIRGVISELCELFKDIRVHPRSNREMTWGDFKKLPESCKIDSLEKAKLYLEICKSTLSDGGDLTDSKQLLLVPMV